MPDYKYLKEFEIEGADPSVIPIGHYSIATWSSSGTSTEHAFDITLESTEQLTRGVLNISCVTQNKGCAMIAIPLNYTKPCSTYKVIHDDGIFESVKYVASSNQKATYKIKCTNACMCNVSLQQYIGCNISDAVNASAATTSINKCEQLTILREGIDYGTELPQHGNTGRIFFVKV